jgi:hypothetical protein
MNVSIKDGKYMGLYYAMTSGLGNRMAISPMDYSGGYFLLNYSFENTIRNDEPNMDLTLSFAETLKQPIMMLIFFNFRNEIKVGNTVTVTEKY